MCPVIRTDGASSFFVNGLDACLDEQHEFPGAKRLVAVLFALSVFPFPRIREMIPCYFRSPRVSFFLGVAEKR
jgi:hypothetical protein